jgi:hypothetical protein
MHSQPGGRGGIPCNDVKKDFLEGLEFETFKTILEKMADEASMCR